MLLKLALKIVGWIPPTGGQHVLYRNSGSDKLQSTEFRNFLVPQGRQHDYPGVLKCDQKWNTTRKYSTYFIDPRTVELLVSSLVKDYNRIVEFGVIQREITLAGEVLNSSQMDSWIHQRDRHR